MKSPVCVLKIMPFLERTALNIENYKLKVIGTAPFSKCNELSIPITNTNHNQFLGRRKRILNEENMKNTEKNSRQDSFAKV